jgi:hypothetical protein
LSEDGRRDGDAEYPRGFATRWSRSRKDDVNEYALFEKNFAATRTAAKSG